jgi:hypothetical protein
MCNGEANRRHDRRHDAHRLDFHRSRGHQPGQEVSSMGNQQQRPEQQQEGEAFVLRLIRHAEERFQRRERHEIAEDDPFADSDPEQEETQQGETGE